MRFEVVHLHRVDGELLGRLDVIARYLGEIRMNLNDLKAALDAQGQVVTTAINTLNDMHTKLQAAIDSGASAADLQALVDEVKGQTASLQSAVDANTATAAQAAAAGAASGTASSTASSTASNGGTDAGAAAQASDTGAGADASASASTGTASAADGAGASTNTGA